MKIKLVLSTFIGVLFIAGCSVQKQVAAPAKQTFTYDYKTPSSSRPGSANTLLALVRPAYAKGFSFSGTDVFANFQQAMAANIEELLIARGYTLKGPYASFDEMVFNDKKDADIALEIEIEPKFTASEGGWKTHAASFGQILLSSGSNTPVSYSYEGTISLIGKINIVGYEPLSKEKLLVKSIEIPSILNINISTSKWVASPAYDLAFFNDPNVYNALGAALQQQYKGIMQKIDAHFDPREFAALKAQIKELKAKKSY